MIDEEGKNLGILSLEEALKIAKERNLDLIQITEKTEPPVCKLGEYGKYLYQSQKKEKEKKKVSEVKGIRLSFNISDHDLETRVNQAEKFLKAGNKIKIEMILRGREKELQNHAKEKIQKFVELLTQKLPIKVDQELKKVPRGFLMQISKK